MRRIEDARLSVDIGRLLPTRRRSDMIGEPQAVHEILMSSLRESRTARAVVSPVEVLRGHPIFGKLPEKVLDQLGTYVTRRRVRRGNVIFTKGDPGTGLMAVLQGTVKISVPTVDGREAVLNLIHAGELF